MLQQSAYQLDVLEKKKKKKNPDQGFSGPYFIADFGHCVPSSKMIYLCNIIVYMAGRKFIAISHYVCNF